MERKEPNGKQVETRTIRVSMDVYKKLCEMGKTNESFISVVDKIFRENNLIPLVTE